MPDESAPDDLIRSADELIARLSKTKRKYDKRKLKTSNEKRRKPSDGPNRNRNRSINSRYHSGPTPGRSKVDKALLVNAQKLEENRSKLDLLPVGKDGDPYYLGFDDVPFTRFLLTKLHTHYNTNDGEYPLLSDLKAWAAEIYPTISPKNPDEWETAFNDIAESLVDRGLPPYTGNRDSPLDAVFVVATQLLIDTGDKRTMAAKLQDVGLTTGQWSAMFRRKRNRDYYLSQFDKVFDEELDVKAKMGIARGIEIGDLSTIKYYHEYTGKYRSYEHNNQNLNDVMVAVIQGLMHILRQHVPSETINIVAAELRTAPAIVNALNAIEASSREVS